MPPSDVYVRSFIYLFYTLIKHYHTKALSNQASSFEFPSSGGQESWHLSGFSNNLSSWGLVWDLNLGHLMPEARTITCRPKEPFKGKLEHLLHFWGSTRCFRRFIFHFFHYYYWELYLSCMYCSCGLFYNFYTRNIILTLKYPKSLCCWLQVYQSRT